MKFPHPKTIVRVRDVMRAEFDIMDGMITVEDALREMKYPDNKAIIIRKRHQDDEFGMLLLTDVAREVLAQDRAPERVNIYEIMTKPVVPLDPDMDIRYCARLFEAFNLTRTLVIENDEVIGVVAFTDLVLRGMGKHLCGVESKTRG
jgi:predicted transcriptional regulator